MQYGRCWSIPAAEWVKDATMEMICSLNDLRTLYDKPSDLAVRKELAHLDKHASDFIGRSPFVIVSTADSEGWPDASPRGDAPGFVTVVDDTAAAPA